MAKPKYEFMELHDPEVLPDLGVCKNHLLTYSRDNDPYADFRFEIIHLWKEGMGCGFGTPMINPETGEIQGQWPHTHVVDEIYYLIGLDPQNPTDLGGEFELWVGAGEDAEKLIITHTSAVRIPAGTPHLPFIVRKLERPFLMIAMPLAPMLHDWSYVTEHPRGIELPDWVDEAEVVWPDKK